MVHKTRRKHRNGATASINTFDFVKYGVDRYDFHDPYHLAIELSWKGFGLAFIALEIAINLIFASLYLMEPGSIANAQPGSFSDAFFFSIETLATVGYGVMAPATFYGHVISAVEIVCGMVFTAMMTGLLFVRFSKPRPKILYADQAVITTHNSETTFMLRLGNGRMSLLINATARLGVLLPEDSLEGKRFRRSRELVLSQSHLPLFGLTWTLTHQINEDSPLFGLDAKRLAELDAHFFVTIEAHDSALGAPVQDLHVYSHKDVVFGMHYAQTLSIDDQKRSVADLSRISLLEPDLAAEAGDDRG